jgi:hypothetical protein
LARGRQELLLKTSARTRAKRLNKREKKEAQKRLALPFSFP